jgi:hypothetical protein
MSDLKKAFAGLREAREPEHLGPQAPKGAATHRPTLVPLPLENTAKSRHPEYTPVKVFLRRDTHKTAVRKWEDAAGGDFSDLVEQLLRRYLGT